VSDSEGEQKPAALEEFTAGLRQLRSEAGDPSFRRMAERSGAVSHATLHLTVKGRRLQPWETVREFVRACGGDEAEWSARYARTKAILSGEIPPDAPATADSGTAGSTTGSTSTESTSTGSTSTESNNTDTDSAQPTSTEPATTEPTGTEPASTGGGTRHSATDPRVDVWDGVVALPEQRSSEGTRRSWAKAWLVAPLVVLIAAAAVLGFRLGDDEEPRQAHARSGSAGEADTVALTEPVHPGDDSALAADLGIQDGAVVAPNQQFTRTFELLNAGSVHWKDRFLQRMENATGPRFCDTPPRVEIPDTAPGDTVKVPVTARAAQEPTTCKVRWKMVDENGRQLLPEKRPVYFMVHVRPDA